VNSSRPATVADGRGHRAGARHRGTKARRCVGRRSSRIANPSGRRQVGHRRPAERVAAQAQLAADTSPQPQQPTESWWRGRRTRCQAADGWRRHPVGDRSPTLHRRQSVHGQLRPLHTRCWELLRSDRLPKPTRRPAVRGGGESGRTSPVASENQAPAAPARTVFAVDSIAWTQRGSYGIGASRPDACRTSAPPHQATDR